MRSIRPSILKANGNQRLGRGFSREELKKAGLNRVEAQRKGLPTDLRRKTVHDENVAAIKAYVEKHKETMKPKPIKPEQKGKKEKAKS